MATETIQTPKSNITRATAANEAKAKDVLMGAGSFLTADTKALLTALQGAYKTAFQLVNTKKAEYSLTTPPLKIKGESTKLMCSDFIITFTRSIRRGIFRRSDLNYYSLDLSGNVPEMNTDAQIQDVADKLIAGDAARMLVAGAVAMAMPPIADVQTERDAFVLARAAHNTASEAVKSARRNLNLMNQGMDEMLRLVHGEVQTRFINLEPAARRDECR